jgi:hypothetical protein
MICSQQFAASSPDIHLSDGNKASSAGPTALIFQLLAFVGPAAAYLGAGALAWYTLPLGLLAAGSKDDGAWILSMLVILGVTGSACGSM